MQTRPVRIAILGGGFAGVYTALELEKRLGHDPGVRITLISRDNFFLFTPMLHEVAASDLDLTHIVSPIRTLLRRTHVFVGEVKAIDLNRRQVVVAHGFDEHRHVEDWDQLVIALGSTTGIHGVPGLEEHALTMKTLGDAMHLRNRVIATLEEADAECATDRRALLTFVVAGGGFAGVETLAGLNDFVREALAFYPNLSADQLRLVLVHSGPEILPELGPELGRFAETRLRRRGVEIRTATRVTAVSEDAVMLSDGETLPTRLVVWTAGTAPHPLLGSLPCARDRGRIVVDEMLAVPGHAGVWALGDCALVPDRRTGRGHPPTAQHALREARTAARNVTATLRGRPLKPFAFRTIGQLAAIGRRTGVARIFGIKFSGFFAWWLWRTIYLSKLPRFEKKVRVALDWTLDLLFTKDFVQFLTERSVLSADRDPLRAGETADTPLDRVEAMR
jgi:NADH dehydrogenase